MLSPHIHLDLIGGLAGDMFAAAAIDANLVDIQALTEGLSSLGLGTGIQLVTKRSRCAALQSTHLHFRGWDPEAESDHRTLSAILNLLDESGLPQAVKGRSKSLFLTLGASEAQVHGLPLEEVHFHEVGAVDSILDFVTAAWIMEMPLPDPMGVAPGNEGGRDLAEGGIDPVSGGPITWSVGPIPTGFGLVETAHGAIPVPVPAAANLLRGFDTLPLPLAAELVTPTGAAILAELRAIGRLTQVRAQGGGGSTIRRLVAIGMGQGTKDLGDHANVVRMLLYDAPKEAKVGGAYWNQETVVRLACEIDDMQPEVLAYVAEEVLPKGGALDVSRTTVVMKGGRVGTSLQVLVEGERRDAVVDLLFRETTTLGVRVEEVSRFTLSRETAIIATPLGEVEVKRAKGAEGEWVNQQPEFRTVVRLAAEKKIPLIEAWRQVERLSTMEQEER